MLAYKSLLIELNSMELPSYNNSSRKGEDGITIVKTIVEKQMQWIFRKNHQEHDFGIDAYIDVISEVGHLTGKSIALQVKTGLSYFNEQISLGWVYRDSIEHLNYYLNHDIPVLILLVNDQNEKVYWNICEPSKTESAGDNWKIVIPVNKEFNVQAKDEIEKYISPVKDYASQLEHFWDVNKQLKEVERLVFNVDKEYIVTKDYAALESGLNRLQVNPELIEALKGKVDIWIDGYENDRRELYEIKEVIEWVNILFKKVLGLTYFITTDKGGSFLRVMQYIKTKYIILQDNVLKPNGRRGRETEIDLTTSEPFLNELFHDLNTFCEKHSIPLEVNKERTWAIVEYLVGEKVPDDLKQ